MKAKQPEPWDALRAAYRPPTPELDLASIMDAVRREAAAAPLRRAEPGLAAGIPPWTCFVAASLAIFAAGFVVGRSATVADRQISQAWLRSIQPDQFEQSILSFSDSSL